MKTMLLKLQVCFAIAMLLLVQAYLAPTPARAELRFSQQATAQETEELTADEKLLEDFKANSAELKETYLRTKKLAQVGSASQNALRLTRYEYQKAELDVLALEFPDQGKKISLTMAKLDYNYAKKEFDIVKRLYQRGAMAELEYDRAKSSFDIAKLAFESAKRADSKTMLDVRVANRKVELAQSIYEKAVNLFRTQTISRVTFDKAKRRLQLAKEELALAKRSVGVRAIQVTPQLNSGK